MRTLRDWVPALVAVVVGIASAVLSVRVSLAHVETIATTNADRIAGVARSHEEHSDLDGHPAVVERVAAVSSTQRQVLARLKHLGDSWLSKSDVDRLMDTIERLSREVAALQPEVRMMREELRDRRSGN